MNKDPSQNTYAVIPERLWNGISDRIQLGKAVVVKGHLIDAIVPIGDIPVSMEKIFLNDCTLLPGLMDAHVHYSSVMGPAFLAAGVTTIRDVGNNLEWILQQRDRHAKDLSAGPSILCCGNLLDGPDIYWPHMGYAHRSATDIKASIQHHVESGVDAIKLYAGVNPTLMKVAVETAHKLGKFVVAHLQDTSAEEAIKFGLDEFEHLFGCEVAWRPSTQLEDDLMIDQLLAHNTIIDPTLVVWDRLGRILDHSFLHDNRRIWVHPHHLFIWQNYQSRNAPQENRWRYQGAMVHLKRFLRRAHERDVTIALGTDTPFPNLVPGMSVHDELAMYFDAGIPAIDALRSATSINAKVLGIDDKAGSIIPGHRADLLAVKGNPIENIQDISNITCTIREGRRFQPKDLLEMVNSFFNHEPDGAVSKDLWEYVKANLKK